MLKRSNVLTKTAILMAIIGTWANVAWAETYYNTSDDRTGNGVWNKTWIDSSSNPVLYTDIISNRNEVRAGVNSNVYTFTGGSIYDGHHNRTLGSAGLLIMGVNRANDLPVVIESSDGTGITFQNWNMHTAGTGNSSIFIAYKGITFGDNITIQNNTVNGNATIGGAIYSESYVTLGNNISLINNVMNGGDPRGGAAIAVYRDNYYTNASDITFGDNAYVVGNQVNASMSNYIFGGGAILNFSVGRVIFGDNVTLNDNAVTTPSTHDYGLGGAIMALGDVIIGNTYNSVSSIANNKMIGGRYGWGGVIYSESNIYLTGSADITGNTASGQGGAIYSSADSFPGSKVQLNLDSGNTIVFRDNKAASVSNAIYMEGGNTLEINYNNGGTTSFYDAFILDSGLAGTASMIQDSASGHGITNIWDTSIVTGSTTVKGGRFALQADITLPSTVDSTPTLYNAANFTTGSLLLNSYSANNKAILDVYDGAVLNTPQLQIGDNSEVYIYGTGALNPTTSDSTFIEFNKSTSATLGSSNIVNLAARTAQQIASNTYNTRGLDDDSKYTALYLNSIGSGNTFILNTDITNNVADKIVIQASASGQNYIKSGYDPRYFAGEKEQATTKTLVVETVGSWGNFAGSFVGAKTDYGVVSWTPNVQYDNNDNNWYIVGEQHGPSTVVDTHTDFTVYALRLANTTLIKRMGELRDNPYEHGMWARYYRGQANLKNGNGDQSYYGIQGGFDNMTEAKDGARKFRGVAVEYINSDNKFKVGRGATTIGNIALYEAWMGNKGHYHDFVLKAHWLRNRMDVMDTENNLLNGAYKTWAGTASFEYGRKKEYKKGYFITPQAQLSYTFVKGTNFSMNNNADLTHANGVHFAQDSSHSLIGRLGVALVRKFDSKSQIYLEGNILHEFMGKVSGIARDNLGQSVGYSAKTGETWLNMAIGSTVKLSKKTDMYVEFEKDFGSRISNRWQAQVGLRHSW